MFGGTPASQQTPLGAGVRGGAAAGVRPTFAGGATASQPPTLSRAAAATPGVVPQFPTPRPTGIRVKEFKIQGEIGEPLTDAELLMRDGKKPKRLTYSNVAFLVNNAVRSGLYQDDEICTAVINQVTVQALREWLEECAMDGDLTVEVLLKRLRTHFKVKDSNHYYKEMLKCAQGPTETTMSFATKMLGLKKMIMRMNREEGGSLTTELIEEEFKKSLYSGLRLNAIRQGLREFLRRKDITDDDLREELSELTLDEKEHEEKHVEKAKEVAATASMVNNNAQLNNVPKQKKEKNPLVGQVASVTKKVDQLEKGMEVLTAEIRDQNRFFQDGLYSGALITYQNTGNRGGFNQRGQRNNQTQPPGAANNNNNQTNNQGAGNGSGNRGQNGGRAGSNVGRGGRFRGSGRDGYRRQFRPPTLCDVCKAANACACNHCFECGEVTHREQDCPKK